MDLIWSNNVINIWGLVMSCEIIAEISSNHSGDMSLAKDMIASAAENGANYVKFQTWKVDRLKPGPWDSDGRRKIYENSELSIDNHWLLKEYCEEKGVSFLTSCFSLHDLEFIRELTPVVKIPSPECSNKILVDKAIDIFDRVIMSVGASTREEYMQYANCKKVWLLHCVSVYPCPYDKVNMQKMIFLKQITPRYGYSGHALGAHDAMMAIALGAKVVEKHFTTDQTLPFRDNKFSILPEDLSVIRSFADSCEHMWINKGCDFQEEESVVREQYGRRWQ